MKIMLLPMAWFGMNAWQLLVVLFFFGAIFTCAAAGTAFANYFFKKK